MKQYELVLILDATAEEGARKELLDAVSAELQSAGVKNLSEDVWGVRKMAYKINGSIEGFYILYKFESNGKHNDLRKFFNLKKAIWRHQFVAIAE